MPPDEQDSTRCEVQHIPANNKVAPHGNGITRIEDQELENALYTWLYSKGLKDTFKKWYQENIDSSRNDPFYPGYDLLVSSHIHVFLEEYDPRYEVIILQDEIDLKIEIQ
jgi:hypothetical protein